MKTAMEITAKKSLSECATSGEDKQKVSMMNGESGHCVKRDTDETSTHAKKKAKTHQESTPPPKESRNSDKEYFKAYSELDIHGSMLSDYVRTFTYRKAILKNYDKFYGKVVLDVGCGTGILSMFCIQAGARLVYGVDASNMIHKAEVIIKDNRMEDKIILIKGKIEEISLPEKVDIIVSEWMGYMLLYETMLPSVLCARDKWLKPHGMIFPERALLYMAPCSDRIGYQESVEIWKTMEQNYSVNMSSMESLARKQFTKGVSVFTVPPETIMAHSNLILSLNLPTLTVEQLKKLESDFSYDCFGRSTLYGFALWFTVLFPGDIDLSTSPYTLETHWQQTMLQIEPLRVHQGTIIKGDISIEPGQKNERFLDVSLRYRVNGRSHHKKYCVDDHIK